MKEKKEIYEAVRNYLINECQINRGDIKEMAEKYIDQKIEQVIIEKLGNVEKTVSVATHGVLQGAFHTRPYKKEMFEDLIRKEIKEQVQTWIANNLKIEVELKAGLRSHG